MKRRNFLKTCLAGVAVAAVPSIAVGAVKALAKTPEVKKYGEYVQAGFDNIPYAGPIPDNAVSLAEKRNIDPYEDVAEHIYKNYWNNSAEMNAAWMKRKS